MSLVLLLLLHSGWLGSVNVVFVVVEATRHTFVAKNAKPLIGPISAPFGFNENGHVKIEITDFVKDWSQSAKENLPPNVDAATLLAKSEAGFLFQRFPNEAAFNQYMDTLRSNASLCAFQHFRQNENNNDFSPYYSNEEGEDPSSEQSRRSDDASYSYGGGGEDDVFPGWGGGDDYDYRYRGGGDSYGIDSATDGLFVSMNYDFGGDEIPSLNYRFQAYVFTCIYIYTPRFIHSFPQCTTIHVSSNRWIRRGLSFFLSHWPFYFVLFFYITIPVEKKASTFSFSKSVPWIRILYPASSSNSTTTTRTVSTIHRTCPRAK